VQVALMFVVLSFARLVGFTEKFVMVGGVLSPMVAVLVFRHELFTCPS
jgi:hypothetical protein